MNKFLLFFLALIVAWIALGFMEVFGEEGQDDEPEEVQVMFQVVDETLILDIVANVESEEFWRKHAKGKPFPTPFGLFLVFQVDVLGRTETKSGEVLLRARVHLERPEIQELREKLKEAEEKEKGPVS